MKTLLIEDDKFFQKFYSTKLQENNISVDIAGDGEEGLLKIKSSKPDLIMLDLIMPKMDGFAFLAARSQDKNLKKIPVVVFSTLGQEKDIAKARELGANSYINKSFFDFSNVIKTINQVMKSG